MLQQTRVQTVKEYYNKWMIKYPSINDVASSDIDDILKSQQITEGYYTVKAVKNIADDKKIEMPIMNAIYNILYNQYNIKDVINNLLERPIKDEIR